VITEENVLNRATAASFKLKYTPICEKCMINYSAKRTYTSITRGEKKKKICMKFNLDEILILLERNIIMSRI